MRIYSGFIKLKPAQVAYFNSLSATDHFLSLILVGLNAYAVYSLYRMRAISLVLFVFALGLNLFLTVWQYMTRPLAQALSAGGQLGEFIGLALLIWFLFYFYGL